MKQPPIRAQGLIKKNRLIMMGIADLRTGPIPFTHSCVIEGSVPDGPVDFFAGEDLHPAVQRALDESQPKIMAQIAGEEMRVGAEDLVVRARAGDQNAMSILTGIHVNAERGNQRALKARECVLAYIDTHPVESDFAGEEMVSTAAQDREARYVTMEKVTRSDDPLKKAIGVQIFAPSLPTERAIVLLANGEPIDKKFVSNILKPYPNPQILEGIKHFRSQISNRPDFRAGQLIGRAQALQKVRKPTASFRALSPAIAWELGE